MMFSPNYYKVLAYQGEGEYLCPWCFSCATDEEEEQRKVCTYNLSSPGPTYCARCGRLLWVVR